MAGIGALAGRIHGPVEGFRQALRLTRQCGVVGLEAAQIVEALERSIGRGGNSRRGQKQIISVGRTAHQQATIRGDEERLGPTDQLVGGRGAEIDGSRGPRKRVGDVRDGLRSEAGVIRGAARCRHRSESTGPVRLKRHVGLAGLADRRLREIEIDGVVSALQARVRPRTDRNSDDEIEHLAGALRRAGGEG